MGVNWFYGIQLDLYLVLLGFTVFDCFFYWALSGFTEFESFFWVLPNFIHDYLVLLGFTWFLASKRV